MHKPWRSSWVKKTKAELPLANTKPVSDMINWTKYTLAKDNKANLAKGDVMLIWVEECKYDTSIFFLKEKKMTLSKKIKTVRFPLRLVTWIFLSTAVSFLTYTRWHQLSSSDLDRTGTVSLVVFTRVVSTRTTLSYRFRLTWPKISFPRCWAQ